MKPEFGRSRWWNDPWELCDIERIYSKAVREARTVLDVGCGDGSRAGRLTGGRVHPPDIHTVDRDESVPAMFRDLKLADEVGVNYEAILCLDVIEHVPLDEGLRMIERMADMLATGGVLVLETGNASYIPEPKSWDMTHVHSYNLQDLWAHLTYLGLHVAGYKIAYYDPRWGWLRKLKARVTAYMKKNVLGCDAEPYIAVIAHKLNR